MNENKEWTIQVFNLHESNYYLCDNQRDLTPIQLLFLVKGGPIYQQYMEEESEKSKAGYKCKMKDPGFRDRYRKKLKEKL